MVRTSHLHFRIPVLFPLLLLTLLALGACGGTKTSAAARVRPATRSVQRFSSDKAEQWMFWSGTALADVVNEDETPGMKLGAVGFTRASAGAKSEFVFAYDEVLVVTKGRCTVESGGVALTASVGEVLYLPAEVPGTFRADEDVELVYVASSPYGAVNREAKKQLLEQSARPPSK
jgi:ethanolamine utilization protein EutQ (cupin superfamily)